LVIASDLIARLNVSARIDENPVTQDH
jgi:hypothetical protein